VAAWDTDRPGKHLDDNTFVARGQVDNGLLVNTSVHRMQLHTSMLCLQQTFNDWQSGGLTLWLAYNIIVAAFWVKLRLTLVMRLPLGIIWPADL